MTKKAMDEGIVVKEGSTMKKKLIKMISTALAAILTAGLLAGCGQSEENALRDLDTDSYVTLCDYQNLSVSVEPITITDEELLYNVVESYSGYATLENSGITDRAVTEGDTVNIDYVGRQSGEAFNGGTASGAFLIIGSDQYIDGFEDGLNGVRPGETVVLPLKFPEDYGVPSLAGSEVEFTVTVNYIMELRDETVASIGLRDVGTVDEFRQYVYDRIYANKKKEYDSNVRKAIVRTLLEQCIYEELPETILESNKEYVYSVLNSMAPYGLSAEAYAQSVYQTDAETYVSGYAAELTKQDITIQAIANHENLTVGDKELKKTLGQYAEDAGYSTVDEYLRGVSMEEYRNYIMTEKVMDYLVEHTTVNN